MYEVLYEVQKLSFSIEDIASVVATFFEVSVDDMKSRSRKQIYVGPRQIAIFFMRHLTKESLKNMAYFFGGRDHTTAIHSLNTVHDLIDTDQEYRNDILNIAAALTQLHHTPV